MNAFYEHHKNNIRFAYRCFDRILLHAAIQPFQQPERAVGFFDFYRQIYPVSRQLLRDRSRTAPRNGVYPFKKIPQAGAMTLWSATSNVPNPIRL